MPDIAMCKDEECPKKETCYRYKATPSEFRQTYFGGDIRQGEECRYHLPLHKFQEYDNE